LQSIGIVRLQLEGAGQSLLRLRITRLRAESRCQTDPRLGVAGSGAHGQPEIFLGAGSVASFANATAVGVSTNAGTNAAFGPLIASAIAALIPDPSVFRSGSDFSASLGITPSQHSSGGKDKLGAITKKGNRYLRKMLVVGCTSVLRVAHKHKGALAEWIVAMRARKPERVVAVALANKLARIAWAMMSTGESFRTELYTKA